MDKQNEVTVGEVAAFAKELHKQQFDKGGNAYFLHVEAVAKALAPFGDHAMMVGYLHDIVEDTNITLEDLRQRGIPEDVIESVRFMSRNLYAEDKTYMDMIRTIASEGTYFSKLGKISDNAHNSRNDRVIPGISQEALDFSRKRYARARKILYPSVAKEDVRKILEIMNPSLLDELKD